MRLRLGTDVWECDCGAIIAIGRVCGCGKTYADILSAHKPAGEGKPKTPRWREPASEGEYTKSFMFKKKGSK